MNVIVGVSTESEPLINVDRDVRIDLFTLKNPTTAQSLQTYDMKSITESNYNPKYPTRIFIHGFQTGHGLRSNLLDGEISLRTKKLGFQKSSSIHFNCSIFRQTSVQCEFDWNKLGKSICYYQLSWCEKKCWSYRTIHSEIHWFYGNFQSFQSMLFNNKYFQTQETHIF